jgi:hypothetical protein
MVIATLLVMALGPSWSWAQQGAPKDKPDAPPPEAAPAPENKPREEAAPLPSPPPIPEVKLGPTLPTTPSRRAPGYNMQMVDASLLPKDKEGIWVLDFAFKPVRMRTVEVDGRRRIVHYMYYRVANHTGQPRMFVPQFSLVTDTGQRIEDTPLPQAVKLIQAREAPEINLLGAVSIMGYIPESTKQGIDDAVYGVAVWDGVDPKADRFSVYVRGLSDGYQLVSPPDGGKPVARYKTLRIDFIRRGDDRHIDEKEILLNEPPYEWVYW